MSSVKSFKNLSKTKIWSCRNIPQVFQNSIIASIAVSVIGFRYTKSSKKVTKIIPQRYLWIHLQRPNAKLFLHKSSWYWLEPRQDEQASKKTWKSGKVVLDLLGGRLTIKMTFKNAIVSTVKPDLTTTSE